MEAFATRTTLWTLLTEPALGLHLFRFALYLLIAVAAEIYCTRKRSDPTSSLLLVGLQLLTGINGIVIAFYTHTGSFRPGDRFSVPIWNGAFATALLASITVLFIWNLLRQTKRPPIRAAILRGIMFAIAVGFALTVIRTPDTVNKMLIEFEQEHQSQN